MRSFRDDMKVGLGNCRRNTRFHGCMERREAEEGRRLERVRVKYHKLAVVEVIQGFLG